eukprot:gb/GECH01014966.1/.p1 GENE.gb/GECH01014966.1/~~gb/GECH01014966.1/.p1  ORF type:complete len:284 (+),score=74.73 gb/GECH01014966.1/:1-852(+)
MGPPLFFVILFIIFILFSIISQKRKNKNSFKVFYDKYKTIEQVQHALHEAGLESSNLILGIDYTKSNETQGRQTFGGKSLHYVATDQYNPYQRAIEIIGRTLEQFDEDKYIPVFGFGDQNTKNHSVFPLAPDETGRYCYGFPEVLETYSRVTPQIILSGPTSFAPVIRKAISIVQDTSHGKPEYHILVIVADGAVVNIQDTVDAIVEASSYPLSIICVGVGDGPWDTMIRFDDHLPQRKFDNFQFVDFHKVMKESGDSDAAFALAALMEVPQQYKALRKLDLL